MQLRYVLRSEIGELFGPQGAPGGLMSWKGAYSPSTAYIADDAVIYEGRGFYALQATTGNAPPTYPDEENAFWGLFAEKGADGTDGLDGITKTWEDMPGDPRRASDTSFVIDDPGNVNEYDKKYPAGTIVSWMESGVWHLAKISSAIYTTDRIEFEVLGNTIVAGFTDMKKCVHRALCDSWSVPLNIPTEPTTNLGKIIMWDEDRYIFSGQVIYGTAATTTGGAWKANADGMTLFISNISIAPGETVGPDTRAACILDTGLTPVPARTAIRLDYISGHPSTPGSDATVFIWSMPVNWRYLP